MYYCVGFTLFVFQNKVFDGLDVGVGELNLGLSPLGQGDGDGNGELNLGLLPGGKAKVLMS